MILRPLPLALALAALAGCSRGAPRGGPTAPPPAPVPDAAIARPAPPRTVEIEISGRLTLPPKAAAAPAPLTFVAMGDCLSPTAKVVGFGGSTFGRFYLEVFAPLGVELTVCAASEPTPGAPSRLYGKAPIVMRTDQPRDVDFHNLVIELAPGPPRRFEHRSSSF